MMNKLFLILWLFCLSATAQVVTPPGCDEEPSVKSVTLSWKAPTKTVDGNQLKLSGIKEYQLEYLLAGNLITKTIDNNKTSIKLNSLPPGLYEFVIYTVDKTGEISEASNIAKIVL